MPIGEIIFIVCVAALFLNYLFKKDEIKNLEDRVGELEDKMNDLEGDDNEYDDDYKISEIESRAFEDDNL
jgi:hypothetical protein